MPLELIHSDVWGPAIASSGGYKYYVSFVDDYSRFSWIYLLKHKSDVEQVFYAFQAHVERLLHTKILAVQSDWGGEYHRLHRYFQRTGISHRVSCPHTSQQNGIAERKHRHLVETGLALLAHSSLPLRFWDEAFLTACYLINRMPTPVLQQDTPIYRLLKVHPDYKFLRTFGCACWPSLRKYNAHKLAFRSTMCVFLGYSPMHKGYKCLDRSTGRIYISRDVVFDESVFPYATPGVTVDVSSLADVLSFPPTEPATGDHMRKYDLSYLSTDTPVPGPVASVQDSSASPSPALNVHGACTPSATAPPWPSRSPPWRSTCMGHARLPARLPRRPARSSPRPAWLVHRLPPRPARPARPRTRPLRPAPPRPPCRVVTRYPPPRCSRMLLRHRHRSSRRPLSRGV